MTALPKSESGPAVFSPDRCYRYTLTRVWDPAGKKLVFIGLNPSTADEHRLDPTLRRCLRFGYDWGYGRFDMLNLFAFRATDPRAMKAAAEPIGPDNNAHIKLVCARADLVVACWGTHGSFKRRDRAVKAMLEAEGIKLHYISLSRDGHPKHPLYLSSELTPREWTT
jgi:hypothetical protein